MPEKIPRVRPFIRWAGGKSKFVSEIVSRLPRLPEGGTYYEPFLGAGAVFLAYEPANAVLSDLNPRLVETFQAIQENAEDVGQKLYSFKLRDAEPFYYRIRDRFNAGNNRVLQAARFIYLNHTCFNGIFRVNKEGRFNVPYGYRENPQIPGKPHLRDVAELLANAEIVLADYSTAVEPARAGDVVYLDPPYPPLNGTSFFTHYTKERFADEDQERVAAVANNLRVRGCSVVVTNADTPLIRRLYRGWSFQEITRSRFITSSKKKHKVVELLFTSF